MQKDRSPAAATVDDATRLVNHRRRERIRRAMRHGVYSGFGFFLFQLTWQQATRAQRSIAFLVTLTLIAGIVVGLLSAVAQFATDKGEDE